MELQHLADFNMGGAKQAGVGQRAESKAVKVDTAEQDSSFKDQVKKQIDQSKADSSKDKTDNNQQDRSSEGEPVAEAVASDDGARNPREDTSEYTESSENTELKTDESVVEDEVLAFNEMLNVTLAPTESTNTGEAVISPVLPEAGNTLPPSIAAAQSISQQGTVAGTDRKSVV